MKRKNRIKKEKYNVLAWLPKYKKIQDPGDYRALIPIVQMYTVVLNLCCK